jgi:hypothetical protein
MTEARIGRLVAASLHQAILDILPQRLDFYEEWLHPDGLRDGSIGLAPITAVIGFLRTEGEAYGRVMARAGSMAAEWTVLSMPTLSRRFVTALPRSLRARAAMRIAKGLIRDVNSLSAARTRVRRDLVRLDVRASLFCASRERQARPLCGFYVAATLETLSRFGLPAQAQIEECRAMAAGTCVITFRLSGARVEDDPALAA